MTGFSITVKTLAIMLGPRIDVITGSNHPWNGLDVADVLAHPHVVRPVNLDEDLGQGVITVKSAAGTLTLVNLPSPTAMHAPPDSCHFCEF